MRPPTLQGKIKQIQAEVCDGATVYGLEIEKLEKELNAEGGWSRWCREFKGRGHG